METEHKLICGLLKSHKYFSRFLHIEVHVYPSLKITGFYLRQDPRQWAQTIYYDPEDLTLSLKIKNHNPNTKVSISDPKCLDKLMTFLLQTEANDIS